ncbi:MAG: hypothetical protein ACJAUP_002172 [Cellvibrionaceae bacterium]|jgi:hypothetical protein
MSNVIVSLTIAADEYIKLYQGSVRSVYTQTAEGRSIRFPANILQPFVTHEGIKGHFSIEFDQENRFKKICRV